MEDKDKKPTENKKIIVENALLKSKIAFSIGSLETVMYLLKSEDPVLLKMNLEHLRKTVNKVLTELKK